MILRDCIALRLPRLGWLMIGLVLVGTLPAWSQAKQPSTGGLTTVGGGTLTLSGTVEVAVAQPLPADAQQILNQFEQMQTAARAEVEQRLAQHRAQVMQQLRELQDRYTKAGQLDEAVAIRDRIRQMAGEAATNANPLVDPPNAMGFRGQVGRQITVTVTGSKEGYVWGSDVYTDDSSIAAAAVHAGVLRPGQRGPVYLTILPGQSGYNGVTRNDVTSMSYPVWAGSYRIDAPLHSYGPVPVSIRRGPLMEDPGTLSSLRDKVGGTLMIKVTGSMTGTIWGSGVYTDDSPLAVAAVHAGVVTMGQTAIVRVTILPGQEQYEGTAQNGVTSFSYHSFPGSYRIEPAAPAPANGPFLRGDRMRWRTTEIRERELSGPLPTPDKLRTQAQAALQAGHPLVLSRLVVGSTQETIWGTDLYADDSSLGVAAVHAGILKDGEEGWVSITLLAGQDSYPGSTRNGVTSHSWSAWGGSFRIERGSPPAETTLNLRILTKDDVEYTIVPDPSVRGMSDKKEAK